MLIDSGIYAIRNKKNGHSYVGSSVQIRMRWRHHVMRLRRGNHHSVALQRAWKRHGTKAFEFVVLESIAVTGRGKGVQIPELIEREQHFLDTGHGRYNCKKIATNRAGQKWSPEVRAQKGAQLKALTDTPEWRKRHSKFMRKRLRDPVVKKQMLERLHAAARSPEGRERSKQRRIAWNKAYGASRHGAPRVFLHDSGEVRVITRQVDFAKEIGCAAGGLSNLVSGAKYRIKGWHYLGEL